MHHLLLVEVRDGPGHGVHMRRTKPIFSVGYKVTIHTIFKKKFENIQRN